MTRKKDDVPKWVTDEIRTAEFGKPEAISRTGYILDVYKEDGKMDAQLYEPVEDGRHIVTVDLPSNMKADGLEKGVVCEFALSSFKAPLSKKAAEFLKSKKGIEMDAIYRFELDGLEPVK